MGATLMSFEEANERLAKVGKRLVEKDDKWAVAVERDLGRYLPSWETQKTWESWPEAATAELGYLVENRDSPQRGLRGVKAGLENETSVITPGADLEERRKALKGVRLTEALTLLLTPLVDGCIAGYVHEGADGAEGKASFVYGPEENATKVTLTLTLEREA